MALFFSRDSSMAHDVEWFDIETFPVIAEDSQYFVCDENSYWIADYWFKEPDGSLRFGTSGLPASPALKWTYALKLPSF